MQISNQINQGNSLAAHLAYECPEPRTEWCQLLCFLHYKDKQLGAKRSEANTQKGEPRIKGFFPLEMINIPPCTLGEQSIEKVILKVGLKAWQSFHLKVGNLPIS